MQEATDLSGAASELLAEAGGLAYLPLARVRVHIARVLPQ
jgi:hypothetical protein